MKIFQKYNFGSFFKKWNGAIFMPLIFAVYYVLNLFVNGFTGESMATLGIIGAVLALGKIFAAELSASLLLFIMHRDYFLVIHEPEVLSNDKKTPLWRDTAYKYYALYFVGAALLMAFA